MKLVKAHAYGNDFLLAHDGQLPGGTDRTALARELCARHTGVGADGLIIYSHVWSSANRAGGAMDLLNADGSYSEVSGNGVRCLAAWFAREHAIGPGGGVDVETDAGVKRLELLEADGPRFTFRAAMGQPEALQQRTIDVDGQPVEAVTLRVGNPQCIVLGPPSHVTQERLHAIAAKLAVHRIFPHGSNVELATVDAPDRVRILIWERGVGPTEASGTGACASAVAAMAFGGASRDVQVASPGGTQRVEWTGEGIFLTGRAELILEGRRLP